MAPQQPRATPHPPPRPPTPPPPPPPHPPRHTPPPRPPPATAYTPADRHCSRANGSASGASSNPNHSAGLHARGNLDRWVSQPTHRRHHHRSSVQSLDGRSHVTIEVWRTRSIRDADGHERGAALSPAGRAATCPAAL